MQNLSYIIAVGHKKFNTIYGALNVIKIAAGNLGQNKCCLLQVYSSFSLSNFLPWHFYDR